MAKKIRDFYFSCCWQVSPLRFPETLEVKLKRSKSSLSLVTSDLRPQKNPEYEWIQGVFRNPLICSLYPSFLTHTYNSGDVGRQGFTAPLQFYSQS